VSTDAIDRDMEVVLPKGVDLAQFRDNPVVLWAHDYKQPPIGRCQWIKLSKDRRRLIAKTEFNHTPLGEMTFNLYRDKFLSAFSIGFLVKSASPPSVKEMEERPELERCWAIIRESVMLEYSAVPVPSNPEALAIAVSKGMAVPGEVRKILVSVPVDIKFEVGDLDEPTAEETTTKSAETAAEAVVEVVEEAVEVVEEEKAAEVETDKALTSVSGPDGGYLVDEDKPKKPKKEEESEEEVKPEDEKGKADSEERCDKCGKLKGECECGKSAEAVAESKAVEPEPVVVDAVVDPEPTPVEEPVAAETPVEEPAAKEVEPDSTKGTVVVQHTPPEEINAVTLPSAEPKAAEEPVEEEKPEEEKAADEGKCRTCGKPMDECKCGDKKAPDKPVCDECGKPKDECECGKAAKPHEEPDEDDKPGGKPDGDADDSKASKPKPKPSDEEDDGDDEEDDDDADDEKVAPKKGVDADEKPACKLIMFRTRKQIEMALVKYMESIDFTALIEKMISDELDRRRGRV
jgi:HK97 family phage prohead protease